MNKLLSLLSVLTIFAFSNATKKVSYSEIINSLAEVAPVQNAASILEQVSTNYADSLKKLNEFNAQISKQCQHIQGGFVKKSAAFALVQKASADRVASLQKSIVQTKEAIASGNKYIAENKKKVSDIKKEMKADKKELDEKSLNVIQRERILKRLLNLIEDELTGQQGKESVSTFKVDNNFSKFSFVEIHNQLAEIETSDPMVKSMITTLILITRDQKKFFTNQVGIKKISEMIKKIMKKDAENLRNYHAAAGKKSASLRKLKDDLYGEIEKVTEKNREHRATITFNNNQITFLNNESNDALKSFQRAQKRNTHNNEACANADKMAKAQANHLNQATQRFKELRNLFA